MKIFNKDQKKTQLNKTKLSCDDFKIGDFVIITCDYDMRIITGQVEVHKIIDKQNGIYVLLSNKNEISTFTQEQASYSKMHATNLTFKPIPDIKVGDQFREIGTIKITDYEVIDILDYKYQILYKLKDAEGKIYMYSSYEINHTLKRR